MRAQSIQEGLRACLCALKELFVYNLHSSVYVQKKWNNHFISWVPKNKVRFQFYKRNGTKTEKTGEATSVLFKFSSWYTELHFKHQCHHCDFFLYLLFRLPSTQSQKASALLVLGERRPLLVLSVKAIQHISVHCEIQCKDYKTSLSQWLFMVIILTSEY